MVRQLPQYGSNQMLSDTKRYSGRNTKSMPSIVHTEQPNSVLDTIHARIERNYRTPATPSPTTARSRPSDFSRAQPVAQAGGNTDYGVYQPRIAECLQLGTQFQPIAPPRSESKRSSYIDSDSVVPPSPDSSVKSSKEKFDVEIMEKELNKEVKIQNKDKKPKDEAKPIIKDELKKKVSGVKNTVKEVTKTVKEVTKKEVKKSIPSTKEAQKEKTKDDYLEALTTLDPQILSIIQSVVQDLNLTNSSTKDTPKCAKASQSVTSAPLGLSKDQLSQLKEQLTKLNDIRSATPAPQPKGTPPPYSATHKTSAPIPELKKTMEEEILERISSRLSVISEQTEPGELSDHDITIGSDNTLGSDRGSCASDDTFNITANLDSDTEGTPTEAPVPPVSSPSPPLPPQQFRNPPETNYTQRAFGMNFSPAYKIDKGVAPTVAESDMAISLNVDETNYSDSSSDGESEVIHLNLKDLKHSLVDRETSRELRTPLPVNCHRIPPVGASITDSGSQRSDSQSSDYQKCGSQNSGGSQTTSKSSGGSTAKSSGSSLNTVIQRPNLKHHTEIRNPMEANPKIPQNLDLRNPMNIDPRNRNESRVDDYPQKLTKISNKPDPLLTEFSNLSMTINRDELLSMKSFTDSDKSSSDKGRKSPSEPPREKKPSSPFLYRKNTSSNNSTSSSSPVGSRDGYAKLGVMRDEVVHSPKGRSLSQERHQSPKDQKHVRSVSVERSVPQERNLPQERSRDSYERRSIRGRKQAPDPNFNRQSYPNVQNEVASPRSSHRAREVPQKEVPGAETVFHPTPNTSRKSKQRPHSQQRPSSLYNGVISDQYFSTTDYSNRQPSDGRQFHSLDKRQRRVQEKEVTDKELRSITSATSLFEEEPANCNIRGNSYRRANDVCSPEYNRAGSPAEYRAGSPGRMSPGQCVSPGVYENLQKIRYPDYDQSKTVVSLDTSSEGTTEGEVSFGRDPYSFQEECDSPSPRDIHAWLRETIHHARLDSESNTTSVEDNIKSDGKCSASTTSSNEWREEPKALNGMVKGYHFDVDAAVAKLKLKKSDSKPVKKNEENPLSSQQKNSSMCNYYNPNVEVKKEPTRRYVPSQGAVTECHSEMMNNPMQFIDLAHERGTLLDMYSDKQSVVDSNVSALFEDSNDADPANLQRLILKHLVKAQSESTDHILPNMKTAKLDEVQPDYLESPSFRSRHCPNKKKNTTKDVSQPNDFRCIGKIIHSTTGKVKVIELYRPSDGYFGFQISPTLQDNKLRVFISGFGHGLTDKLFTGLIAVGDEVLNVNGQSVGSKSFTEVISILSMSQTLLLTIKSNDPKFNQPAGVKPQHDPYSFPTRSRARY